MGNISKADIKEHLKQLGIEVVGNYIRNYAIGLNAQKL